MSAQTPDDPHQHQRRQVDADIAELRRLMERLTLAVIGDPLDRHAPLGLVHRQNIQEEQLADHEVRLIGLESVIPAQHERIEKFRALIVQVDRLEERATTVQEKAGDKTWNQLWDLVKMAAAAAIGVFIGKGGH